MAASAVLEVAVPVYLSELEWEGPVALAPKEAQELLEAYFPASSAMQVPQQHQELAQLDKQAT